MIIAAIKKPSLPATMLKAAALFLLSLSAKSGKNIRPAHFTMLIEWLHRAKALELIHNIARLNAATCVSKQMQQHISELLRLVWQLTVLFHRDVDAESPCTWCSMDVMCNEAFGHSESLVASGFLYIENYIFDTTDPM